jgi:hypothetical protein
MLLIVGKEFVESEVDTVTLTYEYAVAKLYESWEGEKCVVEPPGAV